jgi:cysteine desulfurase/selenocysteine lyase
MMMIVACVPPQTNTTQAPQPFNDLELQTIRANFPLLRQTVHGKPLVYLDNGATTQKPQCVIDRMSRFYETEYATVRRGVYALAEGATAAFEAVRETVRAFLGAASTEEIIFTRGCTEALNTIAFSWSQAYLKAGDVILVSAMEHHANLVPWQQAALRHGATLHSIPLTPLGELDMAAYEALLQHHPVKLVACTHVSNVLGTVNPIAAMAQLAHTAGAVLVVDGAQAAPHMSVDVQALGCDAYSVSGHKVYGPTGVGVLYVKEALLNTLPPYQCGGDMIDEVFDTHSTFLDGHRRFEAGTPSIVEVIGLGEALRYVQALGLPRIAEHEAALLHQATEALQALPQLTIWGQAPHKAGVLSFSVAGVHALDLGTLLDLQGIAVRTGHHCAQPLLRRLGQSSTARASFGLYNTPQEVAYFTEQLPLALAKCKA